MKNFDQGRMKYDASAVADVMELMETIINPFDNEYQALVIMCNGSIAPSEVSSDITTMLERNEAAALSFMESNVLSAEPDIYTSIKKTNLQTFSSINRKVTSKSKNGNVVALKNSKKLFAKMLSIAKSRDLDIEDVLKYSLRPFPAALATMEGNRVKTCKSKLLSIIEAESNEVILLGKFTLSHNFSRFTCSINVNISSPIANKQIRQNLEGHVTSRY